MALTVLTPVSRPHPRYFGDALQSIIGQTSPDWRLIIATEPRELAEVRRLVHAQTQDPRVAVVPNEGRRLAGAVNTGMRLATTEFVALLLADDLWDPSAVEVLTEYIDRFPKVDFFHSARQIVGDDGIPISSVHPACLVVTVDDFASRAPVKHLLCWRRSMGLEVGGLDERFLSTGPDDFDFPWTMAEHGAHFVAVDACLYLYRDHRDAERLSVDVPLSVYVRELRRVLRKHHLDDSTIKRRIAEARATYVRQRRYRSTLTRAAYRLSGRQPPSAWRDHYR